MNAIIDTPPKGREQRRLWILAQAELLSVPAFLTPRWRRLYGHGAR